MVTIDSFTAQSARDLQVAAEIMESLDEHSRTGADLYELFGRRYGAQRMHRALGILERAGLARLTIVPSGHGPTTRVWSAV
jgi:hypothetical protein